jgi:methanogenic corrinoid protein MtbC1
MTKSTHPPTPAAELIDRILAATERFKVVDCDVCLDQAFSAFEPAQLVREVIGPALRQAGERWHRGHFSVVQEHLLSGAVRRQLFHGLDVHNRSASGPTIVFTTLSGERHEMGMLMCAFVAASQGYRAVHLGPDLPVTEIARFCNEVDVAAVALSLVTHAAVIDAADQLAALRKHLPDSVELWIGGIAAEQMPAANIPARTVVMRDLGDFLNRLATLTHNRPTP